MAKIYFVIRIETDRYLVSSIFTILHIFLFILSWKPTCYSSNHTFSTNPISRNRIGFPCSTCVNVNHIITFPPLRFPFVDWKQLRSTGNDRFENRSRSFTIDLKSRWKFRNLESWYRFEREVKQDTASVTGWFSLWKLYIYTFIYISLLIYCVNYMYCVSYMLYVYTYLVTKAFKR